MKRILILVGVLAAAAGAYLVLRSGSSSGSDPGVTRLTDRTGAPPPGVNPGVTRPTDRTSPVPPRPLTLADGDGGVGSAAPPVPTLGGAISFDQEAADPAWAADQEKEMTLRLRRVVEDLGKRGAVVEVEGIECRRTMCRLAVRAHDTDALGKLYGSLESTEGLYGWADNIMLDSVEAELDGQVKTRVTAIFERE